MESLKDGNTLLESVDLLAEGGLNLRLVAAQLGVKVLPVGGGGHGGGEDGLDDEGVVGLEGVAVGLAEGVGEFRGGLVEVVAEGLGGEVEAAAIMILVSMVII